MERLFCALLLLLCTGAVCEVPCPKGKRRGRRRRPRPVFSLETPLTRPLFPLPGAFRPGKGQSCQQCRVCDRTLVYKQKCTETSDARCRCAEGYSCGKNCEACECPVGQQRTITGCQKCTPKTFNNRTTGECRPWSTCPGDRIREPGTEKRDVVCWSGSEIPTTQPSTSLPAFSTTVSEWGNDLILLVTSAFIIIIALCVAFMVLCYFFLRYWLRKKFPKPSHGQLAQEVDDCSYRYPEEEEGGSCEALSSLKGGLLERYYTQDV
ncbi:tumor necrosis factor receptor superfamily member 9-like isoform X1 [Thamnophis elegans]|uniref:tumor necrosis factor receptor superfamily member 9-like isoform X1 n=1 Tax=Thamnophis elegans TaxID=35005 RepID=UPI001379027A|nr:tumor necrosis factor receptor superfamily member 9-like isoform X1 [Thamnophis elegans]